MNRPSVIQARGTALRHSPGQRTSHALPAEFGELAQLAAAVCETPFAAVALDGWGEVRIGETASKAESAERDPFYEHVIAAEGVFTVRDAGRDQRFVGAAPPADPVRGYAACALRADSGEVLGTLAVSDIRPRRFSMQQLAMLASLARQCAVQAALRARVAELEVLNPPPLAAPSARNPEDSRHGAHSADREDELVNARGVLHRAESLLRYTFEQAPIGIAYTDRNGKLLRFNGAFCALLGYDPGELLGGSMRELYAEDIEAADAQRERLWKGEVQFLDFEKRYRRKEGGDLWVRTTSGLVRDGSRADQSVEYLRDITERKRQELELERVHKELMTASREAGMAEVATNVLHNVGNILNSVNISASLVTERLRQAKAGGVARLAALLKEQGDGVGRFITEDERGKRIPVYLGVLGEQLETDRRAALEELTLLRDNLEHIKDTVTMQQSYAKLCGVAETVEVADLVEDSLRLNAGAFARHGVVLQREFGEVPRINVDKHKVLQILVNLVRNAKYACDDSGRTDKRIVLRVERSLSGVRISVIDNGIGIAPENVEKLFRHGFTTRASGHGFGLHSGAIAAQELGGTLRAESRGSGHGATFILELPLAPPQTMRS